MSCRTWQTDLALAACGALEASQRQDLDRHLARCSRCTAELQRLEATIELLHRHGHREPVQARLDHVWTRLEPRLDELDAGRTRSPRTRWWTRTLIQTAAVVLAACAALVIWSNRIGPTAAEPTEPTPDRTAATLEQQYGRYLQRTEPLLLAVANRSASPAAGDAIDAAGERRLAQRLADEASDLGARLHSARHRRESALVADLEVILRQLANLPDSSSGDGLALVQDSLEQRSILFQLSRHQRRMARAAART